MICPSLSPLTQLHSQITQRRQPLTIKRLCVRILILHFKQIPEITFSATQSKSNFILSLKKKSSLTHPFVY